MPNLIEATRRIQEALQKNSEMLDLSGLNLSALPNDFVQIAASLKVLDLHDNAFSSVPAEVINCHNLVSLNLSGNALATGYGLAWPRKLEVLSLDSNKFTEFPIEVLELPQMQHLSISKNKIARLPTGIRLLKNLQTLDVAHCALETLPPEIAAMLGLLHLTLEGNPLRTPPLEIAMQGIGAVRAFFDDLTKNPQAAQGQNHLLAIAIEQYPAQWQYAPRPGGVQECRELIAVLQEKYAYQVYQGLFDQQATRDAILSALKGLTRDTKPNDTVIVYFTGWTGDGLPESDLRSYDNAYIPLPEILGFFASMQARHVLLVVDNHLQSRQFGTLRSIAGERETLASRSALFRIGADWNERFTPGVVAFLKETTLSEFAPEELTFLIQNVQAETFMGYGDQGGRFLLRQNLPTSGAPQPEKETGAIGDETTLINQKLRDIEGLRLQLSGIVASEKAREIRQKIAEMTEEVEVLRVKAGFEAQEVDKSQEWFETIDWNGAAFSNTMESYEGYLKKYPQGLFQNEAQRRLADLQLQQQEKALFADIEQNPNLQSIQTYLTTFPKGQYRAMVEKIMAGLEAEETALWAIAEKANTIAAYQNYQSNTVLGFYREAAFSRIGQLEREGSIGRVNEAKLIFVGNGRVGKTSLSKVLSGGTFDPKENSTHGVNIKHWPVKLSDGRELQLNVWDFGGQEVYHNTHRFFLTTRALYLLVWDKATQEDAQLHPDREDRDRNFTHEYWLQNVAMLSAGSPVVMVQNKVELGKKPINQLELVPKYNIREFLDVSAANGIDLDRLKNALLEQYQAAPGLKELIGYELPENWVAVRQELEELAKTQPYIKLDAYLDICQKHDLSVDAPEKLSQFLTEIGTLLHFPAHKTLKEMVILDPVWATEIIYRVLNKEVEKADGYFTEKQLRDEWSAKISQTFDNKFRFRNDQEVDIFLELMRNFEICFAVPNQPGSFVAPQFLPKNQPNGLVLESNNAFIFGFEYPFLHRGVIARAIVRLSEFSQLGMWWRQGILIERERTKALIEADYEKKQIRVAITGDNPMGLYQFALKNVFEAVNKDMEAREILFCPKCQGALDKKTVDGLREQGEEKAFCAGCKKQVLIADIIKTGKKDMVPKFFISYAHEDRPVKEEFVKWLDNLRWKDKIAIWDDGKILPGAEWDKAVRANFADSDIIVLIVSNDFMASKYVEEVEFAQAFERHENGTAIIIPIIADHCMWEITDIQKIQCLPEDGNPISDAPNRNKVWKEVLVKISDLLGKRFGWGG